MIFVFNVYSSLLLFFAGHLLVFALILWQRSAAQGQKSGLWLSALLGLVTLYLMPWMLGFAGWYDAQPYRNILFYTPCNMGFAIGPAVLLYLRTLLYPGTPVKGWGWHFIPALLYVGFHLVAAVTDLLILPKPFFTGSGTDLDFLPLIQELILISQLVYLVISLRVYRQYRKFIVQEFAFADAIRYAWVQRFLWSYAAFVLISLVFLILGNFVTLNYTGNWYEFLLLGVIYYYVAIAGYGQQLSQYTAHMPEVSMAETYLSPVSTDATATLPQAEEPFNTQELPAESLPENAVLQQQKETLTAFMQTQKPYRQPELSLNTLAQQLGIQRNALSRLINEGFQLNFNDFINQYRVEEVVAALKDPGSRHLTIMSIAYDAGFNSKATFNRAFKKCTGQNPGDFFEK